MMPTHRPKPDDFISLLSSEDEAPLTRKRKYPEDEPASVGGKMASKGRVKRARASPASGHSVTGAKAPAEGRLDEDEGSDGGPPAPGAPGDKKQAGIFAADTVFMPKSPPIFTIHSTSLQLPVFSRQREGTWLTRFTEWAQLLCSANRSPPSAAEITPALIRTAYKQYIDIHSRLKSNKKRAARLVAQQFKDSVLLDLIRAFPPLQDEAAQLTAAVEETLEETLEEVSAGFEVRFDAPRPLALQPQTQILSAAAAPPSLSAEQPGALYIIDVNPQLSQAATARGTIPVSQSVSQPESLPTSQSKHLRQAQYTSIRATMSVPSLIPSGAEAREQQRRYFPSAKDPFNMCLLCGRAGHVAEKCTRSCQFCKKQDHWDFNCPLWAVQCGACFRNGHSMDACQFPREPHFGMCGYCRSPDHVRWECMTLLRTFQPGQGTIRKVNALPVSCAACGSEKHFHADCRKDGVANLAYDSRFHLDNMRQYLDPTSSSGPIIGTDACKEAPRVGGYRICGRAPASAVDNVQYYSGSDDSDEGLCVLAAPVPLRRYNCVPPPPCLQSPSSGSDQSPPTRQTSPSLGSLSSRVASPYRPSWQEPYRPLTPILAAAPRRQDGGRRSGRGGGRGHRNGHTAQNGQATTQDVQRNQEEKVQGGQDSQSGQGEQAGRGGRRSRGRRGKRGGQNGQDGQGPQGGPDVRNAQVDQGGQGGLDGQAAQDGPVDEAGQKAQVGAGEQKRQRKRGGRRGKGGQGTASRQSNIDYSW